MKENRMSRRSFVKVSTASLAALSVPALATASTTGEDPSTLSGDAVPEVPQQQSQAAPAAPAVRPGDSDAITRAFFDSLLVETRYMDADLPSTKFELFGETFDTPIMTAALSHLRVPNGNGLAIYAQGARAAGAVHWMGMGGRQ